MDFFTKLALKRQSVTIIGMLLIIAIGIISFRSLEPELFPEVELNLIAISASYPAAGPEDIVDDITKPIEFAIMSLPNVNKITSTSSEGQTFILVEYPVGTDMKSSEISIKNKLNNLNIPPDADFEVLRFAPGERPILELSISSTENIGELQRFIEETIIPSLEVIDGVQSIEVSGNTEQQITVQIDIDKTTAIGLSPSQIARVIENNNFSIPSGSIFDSGTVINIRGIHQINSLDKLKQLPVKIIESPSAKLIRLSDIAILEVISAPTSSIARTNGIPSILLSISKEKDTSTISITEKSLEVIEETELPSGTDIKIIYNAGPEIQSQLNTLVQEATWGFLFAVIVVFLFLLKPRPNLFIGIQESIRPTIIIATSIPLSILVGIIFLNIQGLTLNFMTLGGLAIAVGRVVDDSIVVLESIFRHIQSGENRFQAALNGTVEVSSAITASTLATVVVFVPLGFIPGLVGSFFFPFSLAVTYALIGSLFVALTIIPVLGLILLRTNKETAAKSATTGETFTLIQRLYQPILSWTLKHKLSTIVISILFTISSMGLLTIIPIVFFPSGADKQISASFKTRPGAPPEEVLGYITSFENHLDTLRPGYVKDYLTIIGGSTLSPGGGPPQFGGVRTITTITISNNAPSNMIDNLRKTFPGNENYSIKFEEINTGGPPNEGVEIQITGSNYNRVKEISQILARGVESIDGVVNIESNISDSQPEITTEINPESALRLGLSSKDVSKQVADAISTKQLGTLIIDERATKVILQPVTSMNSGISTLENILIMGSDSSGSKKIPLKELAEVSIKSSPRIISRINNQRSATITGEISGRNTQAINNDIKKLINSMSLPQDISVQLGGAFTQIREGFRDIGIAIGSGIALVSIVMIGFLGSIRNPAIIVLSLPLASIGMLTALAITNQTLGLPAMMGVLLLIGIIVTNTVVLISFIEQLREKGYTIHNAITEASTIRLRPILMTAFTTSFALLPLAVFTHSDGGLISTELAIAVIGGLVSSTALTLILVPILYEMFHEIIPNKIESILQIVRAKTNN